MNWDDAPCFTPDKSQHLVGIQQQICLAAACETDRYVLGVFRIRTFQIGVGIDEIARKDIRVSAGLLAIESNIDEHRAPCMGVKSRISMPGSTSSRSPS